MSVIVVYTLLVDRVSYALKGDNFASLLGIEKKTSLTFYLWTDSFSRLFESRSLVEVSGKDQNVSKCFSQYWRAFILGTTTGTCYSL